MRTTSSLYLIVLAVVLLALAAPEQLWPWVLVSAGARTNEALVWSAWISTGCAVVGFLVLLLGLVALVRAHSREEAFRPFVEALAPIASEHGQAVRYDAQRGLYFPVRRDGALLDVEVRPHDAVVRVYAAVSPRQQLAWVPRGADTDAPVKTWPVVGSGRAWDLRAELPAMARPLLEDTGLQDLMDRFFARAGAIAVLHVREAGLEVRQALGPSARLERQVREAMDIAYRIRRSNG